MTGILFPVSLSVMAAQGAALPAEPQGAALPAEQAAIPPRPIDISLPLTLDDRYLGDIRVAIQGETITFDGERFIALLQPQLTPEVVAALRARLDQGRLSPTTATIDELKTLYNPAMQQIEVASLLTARGRRLINFNARVSDNLIVNSDPSGFSAFLNTTATFEYRWQAPGDQPKGRQPINGTFDIGGRIGGYNGFAFISRQSFYEDGGLAVIRDETQAIYDNVDRLLRVTAGDLRYRAQSFQSAPQIAGLTVERFFGLQPQRLFRPIGRTQFDLERPSTVEVRLNGVMLQQLLLQPGRYDLRDFPLTQGSNNVQLLIRDDTGRETLIGSEAFFDFDLLEPGISDFSFSGGVRTSLSRNGTIRYSHRPAFSGFYRRGLSNTVTAGANLQADQDGLMAGATLLWASPLGVWRLEGSGSTRSGYGSGYAASVGYLNTGYFGGRSWQWQITANVEHLSRDFTTLDDDRPSLGGAPNQFISTSFDLSATLSNPKVNFTLTGNYNVGRAGRPNTYSGVAGATYNISDRLSATLLGRYSKTGLQREKGAFVQLMWRLGRNSNLRASYDTAREEAEVRFQKSSTRNVGGLTYDVGVRRNDDTDNFAATGNAFYTSNRFEASLQHDYFDTADLDGPRLQATRATLGTSVVFAGGKLAVGRPVQDAFAIVERHRSLAGRKVTIDPTKEGARAYTDALGPAMVPDLQSYDNTALYIDVENLPPGYSLGTGQFSLKAPLYSGYRLEVGSGASYTVVARTLYGDNGQPVVLIGGELQSLDRPQEEAIQGFTNRAGRFAASGLRAGRYRLTLFTSPVFVTEIEVKESDETLVDLGQIKVN